jgi:hypothetical protein
LREIEEVPRVSGLAKSSGRSKRTGATDASGLQARPKETRLGSGSASSDESHCSKFAIVLHDELAAAIRRCLVPIDRDPVPTRYSDLVRRYYEELGKNKATRKISSRRT